MICGQILVFVKVPKTEIPCKQQLSVAVGVPKLQLEPHSTVRLVGQDVNTGGVVSTMTTVWLQLAVLPAQSVTSQLRVINCGQVPLVFVSMIMSVTFVPQHALVARGSSNVQAEPHSFVLFGGQMKVVGHGGFVGVVTLNAMLKGMPCGSVIGVHAAGTGPLPQTAVS